MGMLNIQLYLIQKVANLCEGSFFINPSETWEAFPLPLSPPLSLHPTPPPPSGQPYRPTEQHSDALPPPPATRTISLRVDQNTRFRLLLAALLLAKPSLPLGCVVL